MAQLNAEELDRLATELASYSRTGVPMPAGLQQLATTLPPGKMRQLTASLSEELERGTALSDALEKNRVRTPPEFVALVRCGEISGDLHGILAFAVEHSRRLKRHKSALVTTLIYPLLVICMMILCVWFVALFIIPKFKNIYDQLGAELPLPTQIVVDGSFALTTGIGPLLFVGAMALILYLLVRPSARDGLAAMFSRMPGFRTLAALSDTALLMKFLGRMIGRSVPMSDALYAASLAVWLKESRRSLLRMGEAARQGHPVAQYLSPETPSTAAWLFSRAEERGDLPAVCEGIADYCEDRFDRLSKRAVAVLEPLLLILVSIGVGLVLISLYLPLFNIPKIVGRV